MIFESSSSLSKCENEKEVKHLYLTSKTFLHPIFKCSISGGFEKEKTKPKSFCFSACFGGEYGARTHDLCTASATLSQLS